LNTQTATKAARLQIMAAQASVISSNISHGRLQGPARITSHGAAEALSVHAVPNNAGMFTSPSTSIPVPQASASGNRGVPSVQLRRHPVEDVSIAKSLDTRTEFTRPLQDALAFEVESMAKKVGDYVVGPALCESKLGWIRLATKQNGDTFILKMISKARIANSPSAQQQVSLCMPQRSSVL